MSMSPFKWAGSESHANPVFEDDVVQSTRGQQLRVRPKLKNESVGVGANSLDDIDSPVGDDPLKLEPIADSDALLGNRRAVDFFTQLSGIHAFFQQPRQPRDGGGVSEGEQCMR